MKKRLMIGLLILSVSAFFDTGCGKTSSDKAAAKEDYPEVKDEQADRADDSFAPEDFDPEEVFSDEQGADTFAESYTEDSYGEENYATESFEPSAEEGESGEAHFGPAAAAREKAAQESTFGNANVEGFDDGSTNMDPSERGPKALADERNGREAENDGGYPSDENGYIDWTGEYYLGSKTYVVSGSDKEILDKDAVKNMSDKVLRLAINEIYARHGRKFNSKELQDFFNSKEWYTPKYEPEEFDKKQNSILNDVEIKNLETMTAERSRRSN